MSPTKKKSSKPSAPVKVAAAPRRAPRYSAPITDLETEFALHVLRGTGNIDDTDTARIEYASRLCGVTPDQGRRAFARVQVRRFMEDHKRREAEVLVQMEVRSIRRKGMGKAEILAHFDRLAAIDPERTRGSITGQVAATVAAATVLGLNVAARDPDKLFAGRTPEELDFYAKHGRFQQTLDGATLQ